MELNRGNHSVGSRALMSCAGAFLLVAGCEAQPATTGVRLAIGYDSPPARLRVEGHSERGANYGPSLLPDPPRALHEDGESVLLALPDSLTGTTLTLDVTGLDQDGAPRSHASKRVRVREGAIVQLFVQLSDEAPLDAGVPDAGSISIVLPDAAVPDASSIDAGPLPIDAGPTNPGPGDPGPVDPGPTDLPAPIDPPAVNPPAVDPPAVDPPAPADPPAPTVPPPVDAGVKDAAVVDAASPPVVERCGDGMCQPARGETPCTCTQDCGASKCGDGECCPETGENVCSCPSDCGASSCGDGLCCQPSGEDTCTCAGDCGQPTNTSCAYSCTGAACTFDCQHSKSCSATCSGSADCHILCQHAEDCSAVRCDAPAKCLLECDGSKKCSFASCPAGAMSCPKMRIACNEPCPAK